MSYQDTELDLETYKKHKVSFQNYLNSLSWFHRDVYSEFHSDYTQNHYKAYCFINGGFVGIFLGAITGLLTTCFFGPLSSLSILGIAGIGMVAGCIIGMVARHLIIMAHECYILNGFEDYQKNPTVNHQSHQHENPSSSSFIGQTLNIVQETWISGAF